MGYTEVKNCINGTKQFICHDDCAINGLNHILHCCLHNVQDHGEALDFLEQENVERKLLSRTRQSARSLQVSKLFFHLKFNEVCWQILYEFVLKFFLHNVFFRLALTAR